MGKPLAGQVDMEVRCSVDVRSALMAVSTWSARMPTSFRNARKALSPWQRRSAVGVLPRRDQEKLIL